MIVAVINIKGGCGKTTTAMALATLAARDGMEAVVLDADEQSSASLWAYSADESDTPMPFDVRSANIADLRRLKSDDRFVVIDTPPSGKMTDEAKDVADFVVVPTSPNSIDLQQTMAVVDVMETVGKPYAVLIVRAERRTTALKSAQEFFKDKDTSIFDTVIPKKADLGNIYGQPFPSNLHGYEDIYKELMEATACQSK
jgi:chromosome partitioning protein